MELYHGYYACEVSSGAVSALVATFFKYSCEKPPPRGGFLLVRHVERTDQALKMPSTHARESPMTWKDVRGNPPLHDMLPKSAVKMVTPSISDDSSAFKQSWRFLNYLSH